MAKPRHRNNFCYRCEEPYYRRNLMEVWVQRNPGHRAGNRKEIVKICLKCMSKETSERVVVMARVGTAQDIRRREQGGGGQNR